LRFWKEPKSRYNGKRNTKAWGGVNLYDPAEMQRHLRVYAEACQDIKSGRIDRMEKDLKDKISLNSRAMLQNGPFKSVYDGKTVDEISFQNKDCPDSFVTWTLHYDELKEDLKKGSDRFEQLIAEQKTTGETLARLDERIQLLLDRQDAHTRVTG